MFWAILWRLTLISGLLVKNLITFLDSFNTLLLASKTIELAFTWLMYVCSSGKGLDWIDCKLLPKTSEYSCNKNNSLFFLCTYMYIYRYLVYVSLEKRLKRIFSHHQSLIKIARDCLTTLYHFYFFLHNDFKLVWITVDLCTM